MPRKRSADRRGQTVRLQLFTGRVVFDDLPHPCVALFALPSMSFFQQRVCIRCSLHRLGNLPEVFTKTLVRCTSVEYVPPLL